MSAPDIGTVERQLLAVLVDQYGWEAVVTAVAKIESDTRKAHDWLEANAQRQADKRKPRRKGNVVYLPRRA